MHHKPHRRDCPEAGGDPFPGWQPQVDLPVPNFWVDTTSGPLDFASWSKGSWVVLFGHPAAMSPICTTEIVALARAEAEFTRREVKILVLSGTPVETNLEWLRDIQGVSGTRPRFPLASDESGAVLRLFGMVHPQGRSVCAVRKSVVIGPDGRIRLIVEYPMSIGRSTGELLRSIDALQTVEVFNVGTGADWQRGEDCLAVGFAYPGRSAADWRQETSYLVHVPDPWELVPGLRVPGRR